ncbi:NUDIX domain-containing protein [Candidatus Gracilibacteria bacterium]|nr:NUDIX domain-containing protein [Candidatus Gracilibacteria bacterium]
MPENIIIVDKNDNIVGHIDRDMRKEADIFRVSALWIINSQGEILLAKRHMSKKSNPGLWGPAVAGTNAVGETYESNIYKEAEEEIGITNTLFLKNIKIERFDTSAKHFLQWFTIKMDMAISEFRLQENEVEEVRWWSKQDLEKELREKPELFLKSMPRYLEMFADL